MPSLRFTEREILQTSIGDSEWVAGNGLKGVLQEANVTITDKNKAKVDSVIHKYIGEQSSYGNCSADWKKASLQIKESPQDESGTNRQTQNARVKLHPQPTFSFPSRQTRKQV